MTDGLGGAAAVVTGGASGLGAAIAQGLAAAGAGVVVADLDGRGADSVTAAIVAGGGRGAAVQGDVTSAGDVDRMISAAGELGRLSVLVLSAAVEVRRSIVDCDDADWRRVIDTNLKGAFLCLRAAVPVLAAGGGGSVIALGSTLGLIAAPGYPAYCASKGALVNLCKQAAVEHAPDQIRVNVLAPSATEAGLFWRMTASAPDPNEARRRVAGRVPAGRLGRPDDVVGAVLFLASPAASYISGAVIPLDGGLAARRS